MGQILERADGYDVDLGSALIVGPAVDRFIGRLEENGGEQYQTLANVLGATFLDEVVEADEWANAEAEARELLEGSTALIKDDDELIAVLKSFIGEGEEDGDDDEDEDEDVDAA